MATTVLASFICLIMCASDEAITEMIAAPVFACNLRGISAAQRPRYNELVKRIRTSIHNRREIAHGYVFEVDSKAVTLSEAAEWVRMERLCCPFLSLQLAPSGNQAYWLLTLVGPQGVKPFIKAEFPHL